METLLELALYEIFDILPFVVLAIIPFRSLICSRQKAAALIVLLYFMGIIRRMISLNFPQASMLLAFAWILLYLLAYCFAVRQPVSKLLFILITVLNYASLCAILYAYMGERVFSMVLTSNPYGLTASISAAACLAITYPLICCWFYGEVTSVIIPKEYDYLWKKLWLVPATFCVFFYYSLYSTGNLLSYAGNTSNLLFSLIISTGFFFVMTLVLRLVKASMQVTYLEVERHHLEIHELQYQRLSERIEEARRARHDLRQSLNVLQVFLDKGDTENLFSYISQFCSSVPMDSPMTYCLYPPLNALICYYCEMALQNGAAFDAQVDYPEDATVTNTDVIVLFGNLLENAVEACTRQKEGTRFIHLKAEPCKDYIVITMENSCKGDLRQKGEDFYSSKRPGLGIGTSSVRRIAKKYGGMAQFKCKGDIFYSSVMLNYETKT